MYIAIHTEMGESFRIYEGQLSTHLALRVDHVGVVPELVAQVLVDGVVEETVLPALFSPQKVVLKGGKMCSRIFSSILIFGLTSARMRQYRQVCADRRRSRGDRKDRM